jgi:hypothetical protein
LSVIKLWDIVPTASYHSVICLRKFHMSYDNCSWGEQWRCGWLTNPVQKGKVYYADLKMHVLTKKHAPTDYHFCTPARGRGFILTKEVEIPQEVYLELIS